MPKRYRHKSIYDLKAEHTAHIVKMLKEGKKDEAEVALQELCLSCKERPQYVCFMLARKLQQDAKEL